MTSSRIEVGATRCPTAGTLGPIRRDDDVVALLLERVLQESLDVRVVIDDEDLGCHQTSRRMDAGAPRSRTATPARRL
jgi:hypothetical protein